MNMTRLRAKILDLAIRGKLVAQEEGDEPASMLLERIRAEKVQLVAEKKLKRKDIAKDSTIYIGADNQHWERFADGTEKCIEDEIPFALPKGWAWARMSSICLINPRSKLDDTEEVSFIPMTRIEEGFSGNHTSEIRTWKDVKSGFTHFQDGDVGIAKISPCFENRKSVIFHGLRHGYGAGTTELHILRTFPDTVLPIYLLWYTKTEDFIRRGMRTYRGAVGQQRVGRDFLEKYIIAIPPLAEQVRIAEKVSALFSIVERLDRAKGDLQDTVERTRKKLLSLAIRGKLVVQEEGDEPASVLLERIRAEKEELIAEKKLKKSKPLPPIKDEEKPFAIPESWTWVRFEDVGHFISGYTPKVEQLSSQGTIPYFKVSDMNAEGNGRTLQFTSLYWNDACGKPKTYEQGTIVYPKNGGAVLTNKRRVLQRDSIVDLNTGGYKPLNGFLLPYVYYIFSSIDFKKYNKGSVLPTLDTDKIRRLPIPLPPLTEQARIATLLDRAFSKLRQIEESLP